MKKLLAALLSVTMLFAATACTEKSDNGSNKSNSNSGGQNVVAVESNSEVADYVTELKNSADWKTVKNTLAEQGLDVDIEAQGNNIVYIYTYTTAFTDDQEDSIVEYMESYFDTVLNLDGMVAEIKKEVPAVDGIVIELYASDGDLLLTMAK